MNALTKQKQTPRFQKQTYSYLRGKCARGINQEYRISRYKQLILYIKQINN